MEIKKIRNSSNQANSIVYRGRKFVLGAYEETNFEKEIAELFLENYPESIKLADDDFGGIAQASVKSESVWLANMTGNPDAPEKIRVKIWKDKRWQTVDEDNPLRRPWELTERLGGGMQEYTAKDGALMALNLPSKLVTIPPYKRVELDPATATWFMTRSSLSVPKAAEGYQPVKVVVSRKPSNFEPDMSWELDELVAYLGLIDPNAKPGDTELQTRKKAEKAKCNKEEVAFKVEEAKRLMLKRIYFRVVDPRYRLPTRQEFKDFMDGPASQPKTSTEEAVALIERAAKDIDEANKNE